MWKHLFLDGEFSPRERLLSGLTLEQVTRRPAGASHSIYEELWHATTWQRIVVERGDVGGDVSLGGEPDYPSEPPDSEQAWHDLVTTFLAGAAKAVACGQSREQVGTEIVPGLPTAEALHSLAVHNAYHLGKIVALRQLIGAWPPKLD